MGREFELKYAASAENQRKIREEYGNFQEISMETEYFDTPSGALAARKWTLRCRRENEKRICTLKTPAADGSRGEWETEAADIYGALSVLCKLGAPEALLSLAEEGLIRVCGARFTRLAKEILLPNAVCELALDAGELLGGDEASPLCEVEVELKAGSEAAVLAFAASLSAKYGLKPEEKSKFQRALALAKGEV